MGHIKKLISSGVFLGLLAFTSLMTIMEVQASEMNFDVKAVIPENQVDKNNTYFDLLVTPGQKQTLTYLVENTSKKTIQMSVELNPGWTNHNGLVSYAASEVPVDKSLKQPITSLIKQKTQHFALKGQEVKELRYDLEMPNESFNGIIVGGFTFKETSDEQASATEDEVLIRNEIHIMKGIKLRQNEEPVAEKLVINEAKAQIIGYHQAFTINIQNPEPMFVHEGEANIKVLKAKTGEVVITEQKKINSMAPNSNVDLPIYYDEVLSAGDYKLVIDLKTAKSTVSKAVDFAVTRQQVKEIKNLISPEKTAQNNRGFILKLVLISIFTILFVIFLAVYLKAKGDKTKRRKVKGE